MALVWNWKDKCGEMCVIQSHPDEEDQMFTVDLYQGNAYLIMIHEYKKADKDKYSVTIQSKGTKRGELWKR